jgi:hypothetical protein
MEDREIRPFYEGILTGNSYGIRIQNGLSSGLAVCLLGQLFEGVVMATLV